ncbi:MAG: hypothetical protein IJ849_05605 [Selenomonadaceae bacterium]|nr:hypothetical protein [Selenomonadaceae bacterium]
MSLKFMSSHLKQIYRVDRWKIFASLHYTAMLAEKVYGLAKSGIFRSNVGIIFLVYSISRFFYVQHMRMASVVVLDVSIAAVFAVAAVNNNG